MIYQFQDVKKSLDLACDAVVIGSGAGGAVVAKELAEVGLKVVLLEEGGYYRTEDFLVNDTVESTARLFRDGGACAILGKPNIMFAEGRCVGGSTTINGGICWRTPEKIMKRWQWERGLADFTPYQMDSFFSRVEQIIQAKPMIPEARNRDGELLKSGAEKLGYSVRANIRSQDDCVGANQCISGCPTGAKQATLINYIPMFIKAGGELFANCRVTKVVTKHGQATGVEGYFVDPLTKAHTHKIKVHSNIVVVCGGAVQTPALLMRSRIHDEGRLLGKNLIVHPNAKVLAVFNEEVRPWSGVNQGFQITEFFDEGLLMAVQFVPPGIISLGLPLGGLRLFKKKKQEFHHLVMGGVLVEDTGSGRIRLGPFDSVFPTYNLNERDFHQVIRGVALLSEVFFAAGARKCYLPFANMTELRSVDDIPKIYQLPMRPSDLELMTVHIMGTAQMGSDPRRSVVNSHGEFHNLKGLFVADASVFPTSIGVNPQVTIMALATRTAAYIAENFSDYRM